MTKVGEHVTLDIIGTTKEYDPSIYEKVINDIAKAAKVTILNISKYKFEPQGFTILALLAESHISFHTFPEKGIISFDFFTCGKVNPSIALDIIKKVKYAHAYSFKYSPRPGTPAALKEDQIDEEVKSDRLKTLQELIRQQTRNFNSGFLEKEINVLIEKKGIGENRLTGRSSYLQPVHITGDTSLIGEILKVKIIKTRDNSLEGIIL